ncbi:B12-binding domain-containing protein [Chloroflexota bacterium]
MKNDLVHALSELEEDQAITIAKARLAAGEDPLNILLDGRKGLEIVGKRFEEKYYFIPDLVYSGEILKRIVEIVDVKLGAVANPKKHGKVVIGTVSGDIHDIGKNIVTFMLDINGFEVYDLGIDVPHVKFIEAISDTGATVIGLSGFFTLAYDAMKGCIEQITNAGLRDRVKIMIGGGMIDGLICQYTGADGYGTDATAAVNMARDWLGVGRND